MLKNKLNFLSLFIFSLISMITKISSIIITECNQQNVRICYNKCQPKYIIKCFQNQNGQLMICECIKFPI